jgi:predicted type IV restriction endonuclease
VSEEFKNREEFRNRLLSYAKKVIDKAPQAQNEEATKQYLIIPFFALLGYDPYDPDEIVPEADASFSDKFKNRVDYAIRKEGDPVIAVEAKKVGSLTTANRGELKGYYNAMPTVKLGILTDGIIYQLYSDTEEENLMDDEPYTVVDLEKVAQEGITDDALDALSNVHSAKFDPGNVGAEARRKIYISSYVEALDAAFKDPNESVIRTLIDLAGIEGNKTSKLLQEHKHYITEAMSMFFDKKLLERVGFAEREVVPLPDPQPPPPTEEDQSNEPPKIDADIVTTEEEQAVYDYVRQRLPFLIPRDEEIFRKLDHINAKDYKGTFIVSYKKTQKGKLFNFREGADAKYHFEFPESGATITTDTLSDIDNELLAIFTKRVEELG